MNQTANSPEGGKGPSKSKRILWPLLLWGVFFLALVAYSTHRKKMAQTRVVFSVAVEGRSSSGEESILLDGQPVTSGQQVSLGKHQLAASHPLGEPFKTNFSMGYGERNLGAITLKRTRGTLSVHAEPAAPLLSIQGPEFSLMLTNSAGVTSSVPVDSYQITTKYKRWENSEIVNVTRNLTTACQIVPPLGTAQLECNQEGATFELLTNDQRIESSVFPATLDGLPQGAYKLIAVHHKARQELDINVASGKTNTVQVQFLYGAVTVETEPPGAWVSSPAGEDFGKTPIQISERQPGTLDLVLAKDGYFPVSLSVVVVSNQTNAVRTNLINETYVTGMKAAGEFLKAKEYDQALASVEQALRAQPDDAAATAMHKQASGLRYIREAKSLGDQQMYARAVEALKSALETLPDNEEAKSLLERFTKIQSDTAKQLEQAKRIRHTKEAFDALAAKNNGHNLFRAHELAASQSATDAAQLIRTAFADSKLFKKIGDTSPEAGIVQLTFRMQELGDTRVCIVVCGDGEGGKTRVIYKLLLYSTEEGRNTYTPLNPNDASLRSRITTKTQHVSTLIERALGKR